MKEVPMLFSTPMMLANLAGAKDVTRRIMKNPDWLGCTTGDCPHNTQAECDAAMAQHCRYKAGDVLWARETFTVCDGHDPLQGEHDADIVVYRAGGSMAFERDTHKCLGPAAFGEQEAKVYGDGWHPSIHMPRWACRFTAKIVSVRAERLHDITEDDAIREGLTVAGCEEVFRQAAGKTEMRHGRWLETSKRESIEGDWCVKCVDKAAKKLKATIDGWDDYPESDSPRWCEECGTLITHSLTEYGVNRELCLEDRNDNREHYPCCPQDAKIMENLAGGIGDLRDAHKGRLAQIAYATLWDSINGRGSWASNPWVWRIEYANPNKGGRTEHT